MALNLLPSFSIGVGAPVGVWAFPAEWINDNDAATSSRRSQGEQAKTDGRDIKCGMGRSRSTEQGAARRIPPREEHEL
jgi:hypothetical protein